MITNESTIENQLAIYGQVWNKSSHAADIYERDRDLQRILEQIEKIGRSFLLIGPSGVGKTTLIRKAAEQLASKSRLPWLILETNTSSLIAGKKYIGEWQGVVKNMVEIAQREERVAIWFSDLINLVGVGKFDGCDETMASALAPLMDRREIIILGECTPESYKAIMEPHPWFARLLDKILIEPHSPDASRRVVERVATRMVESFGAEHGCPFCWTQEALDRATQYGEIYFPDMSRPAGALRLIETTLQDSIVLPRWMEEISTENKKTARWDIPPECVIEALSLVTGTPRRLLDDSIPLRLAEVQSFFCERLVGQRRAIDAVVDLIALIKAGLTDPGKPMGTMLFAGPTGVGKTELARTLAEYVFGSADRLIRLDMSEYQNYDAVAKLVGGPNMPDTPGGLLSRVKQHPFSVILLDEIEKADASVFDLLLQLLDAGRLTRATGETINFTQTVIILTSNLGSAIPESHSFGFRASGEIAEDSDQAEEQLELAIRNFFRPELVNRIGRIIRFDPLTREDVRALASREVGAVLMRNGIRRRRLQIDIDRGVIDVLAEAGYDARYGARPLKRAVERMVLAPLARFLSEMDSQQPPTLVQLYPSGDGIKLRSIDEARTRRESMEGRIRVADPVDGRTRRIDRGGLSQMLGEFRDALDEVEATFRARNYATRKSQLVEMSGARDFWDDASAASAHLAELYRIERLQEVIESLERGHRDLESKLKKAKSENAAVALPKLFVEIEQRRQEVSLARFAMLCQDHRQQSDAFVVLQAIDPSSSKQLPRAANSYKAWADRLGFRSATIHEEAFDSGELKQLVLLIEGVAVFRILEGEQGLHEFDEGPSRGKSMIKISILAISDRRLDDSNVDIVRRSSRARGRFIPSLKTEVTATYRPTGQSVRLRNNLDAATAEDCARDLLGSEIERQNELKQSDRDKEDRTAYPIVRRWWLGKQSDVRDPRTNASVRRIKDVEAGRIDPFLLAWLEQP
jgi:ATP-dependent Clp protease ATP-binding subunit ClpC